jgi:hypothetical protein
MSENTTLYLRGLPTPVVREAKAVAARRGCTLAALVGEALARSVQEYAPDPGNDGLRDAQAWYQRNRRRLLARHLGEFVAVVDRAVVDHDRSFSDLAERVFARYRGRPVYIPRVQEEDAPVRVRSPRRART